MRVVKLESKNDDPYEGKFQELTKGPCKTPTFVSQISFQASKCLKNDLLETSWDDFLDQAPKWLKNDLLETSWDDFLDQAPKWFKIDLSDASGDHFLDLASPT